MKKNIYFVLVLILSVLFITNSVHAISLFSAQDIAKKYTQGNEMVDLYSQQTIFCDNNSYFVIPINNSLGEQSFFVPISFTTGDVVISSNNNNNFDLLQTAYILKQLSYSNSKNYLTTQLTDKIANSISVLNSKKSRLEGIIAGDYPVSIKQNVTVTKNKLSSLINILTELNTNLSKLLKKQQDFLYSPDCVSTSGLLESFGNSFNGYKDLTKASLDYINSVENITKVVVSDNTMNDSKKRALMDYVAVPSNLNSDIGLIHDSLSSTFGFYNNIIINSSGDTGRKKIQLMIDNLISRRDYVTVKALLGDFDPDFPKYNNLNSVISTILNPDYKIYWKDQDDVDILDQLYSQIKELQSNSEYTKEIPKIRLAKSKSKTILEQGFMESQDTTNYYIYYIISAIVIVLLAFFFLFKFKKKDKKKKEDSSGFDVVDSDDLLN